MDRTDTALVLMVVMTVVSIVIVSGRYERALERDAMVVRRYQRAYTQATENCGLDYQKAVNSGGLTIE